MIVAHEVCHVRRHDNVAASIHMFAEALFWFYRVLRWMGKQLIHERERACDEEVVGSAADADVYAQGIVNVCKFYVEAQFTAACGISGSSNLSKRIEQIMSTEGVRNLTKAKKATLAAAVIIVVALPFAIGAVNSSLTFAQTKNAAVLQFEVASVKPNKSRALPGSLIQPAGRFTATNQTLKRLILNAYHIPQFRLSGAPSWIESERYDIDAKAAPGVVSSGPLNDESASQVRSMLQTLLAERFKLRVHRETKELPIYALVIAKGGPKLKNADVRRDCLQVTNYCHGVVGGPRLLNGYTVTMTELAGALTTFIGEDRAVVDKTGLPGTFDIQLHWTPSDYKGNPEDQPKNEAGPAVDPNGPTVFTALQEQLGLRLESQKGPVDIIVIDNVEKLSEN
jgi:uncharacterized protein (TIGR03435 family)